MWQVARVFVPFFIVVVAGELVWVNQSSKCKGIDVILDGKLWLFELSVCLLQLFVISFFKLVLVHHVVDTFRKKFLDMLVQLGLHFTLTIFVLTLNMPQYSDV